MYYINTIVLLIVGFMRNNKKCNKKLKLVIYLALVQNTMRNNRNFNERILFLDRRDLFTTTRKAGVV